MNRYGLLLASAVLSFCLTAPGQEARLTVHADQVSHRISRYLTGACIEDVNHEVYGGLYSQMIFGESFQEPTSAAPFKSFSSFGGSWEAKEGVLMAAAGDGPKLIADGQELVAGEVGVEVYLPGGKGGNAGLIARVSDAGFGADKFTGYEIALDPAGALVLGRHRQNWEPLRRVPCEVPADQWIPLVARFKENSIEILVEGKSVLSYEDRDHPLTGGKVGLRTWQRPARFRNFYVREDAGARSLPFEPVVQGWPGQVSGMWREIGNGARGQFELETKNPFTGTQSQLITFPENARDKSPPAVLGIENRGLNRWGMGFVQGRRYEGYLWARAEQPAQVYLSLESGDGSRIYCEILLEVKSREWERLDFKVTPDASDAAGRFAIKLKQPGTVCIGQAFLEPGKWGRFRGLPVRKDVTEGLVAQGLTVMRYGGSMVNHADYRWKKMIGPRDRRPPSPGTWYQWSSNGWGIFDFLNFCEAAGLLGIPAVNMDESPQDMADFVQYANAPTDTTWGRRRAADGHPAPYRLQYVELGNEEAVDDAYWKKFKPLAEAMWANDPKLVLVVGDFAYDKPITDPYLFNGAPLIHTLAPHKKILDLAREHGREVWFDVHIGTEAPPAPAGLPGVLSFIDQLGKLSPGAKFKVAIFEFNAGNHALKRALSNACAINQIERLAPAISVACSANCLQPDGQNDNGWDQGLLFLSPSQVWPQPPYYVTQMVSDNYQPLCVAAECASAGNVLDATATRSENGRTIVLQVVNSGATSVPTAIALDGFHLRKSTAHATVLAGDLEAVNTAKQPERIKSVKGEWRPEFANNQTSYTFQPHSFTILRFE